MLKIILTDIFDKKTQQYPLFCTIDMEEDVPADSLFCRFNSFLCDELKDIEAYDDDKLIFKGIVDEQLFKRTESGAVIEVSARSMAALLLDNESVPVSYTNPSTAVIVKKHLARFNDIAKSGNDTYFGNLTVHKGDSDYKAVESFCKKVYKTSPRVTCDGTLFLNEVIKDSEVCFSDYADGIMYNSFCENIKRYKELSKIRVKLINSSGYNSVIENKDAINRGIDRERYLNAVMTDTPAIFAQDMINKSKENSYLVILMCKGQQLDTFMCNATINDSEKGQLRGLYVSSVHYKLDTAGESTAVTLKRKDY